jgi:hypothetical protein
MKWKEHLIGNEQSLARQLTSRINGLLKVCARAPLPTRLMVANGIFMSKLCYLIQLWGSADKYLIKALQVLQNKAAIRFGELFEGKTSLTHDSFCYMGANSYNRIPTNIRSSRTLQTFKYNVKKWISSNIPIDYFFFKFDYNIVLYAI